MTFEVEVTCSCSKCKKTLDEYSANIHCHECLRDNDYTEVFDTSRYISTEHAEWKDVDYFDGFNSEQEKEIYLKGVKYGMHNALFWICHYFGNIEFFEKEVSPNFDYQPDEENQYVS